MGRIHMNECCPTVFVSLAMVAAREPAQALRRPPDAKHRKLRKTNQKNFLVGPDLSTVIACRVTERQPGGNYRVGEALPRLADEEAP